MRMSKWLLEATVCQGSSLWVYDLLAAQSGRTEARPGLNKRQRDERIAEYRSARAFMAQSMRIQLRACAFGSVRTPQALLSSPARPGE